MSTDDTFLPPDREPAKNPQGEPKADAAVLTPPVSDPETFGVFASDDRHDPLAGTQLSEVIGPYRLLMQLCEGVQHAHQKGVIHRDLKPSNVLVALQDQKPVSKIIDFGVSKGRIRR